MNPKPSELRFKTLCDFFDLCVKRKKPAQKKQLLKDFADKFIERGSSDVYEIYRLLAPAVSCKQCAVAKSQYADRSTNCI